PKFRSVKNFDIEADGSLLSRGLIQTCGFLVGHRNLISASALNADVGSKAVRHFHPEVPCPAGIGYQLGNFILNPQGASVDGRCLAPKAGTIKQENRAPGCYQSEGGKLAEDPAADDSDVCMRGKSSTRTAL